MSVQELPNSLESEQMILGMILAFPESWPQIACNVSSDDFYPERHRIIYAAIKELHRTGRPIDFVSLNDLLKTNNSLEVAGGGGYLLELVDLVGTSAGADYYAKKIKDLSLQRSMYRAFASITQSVCAAGVDLTEILSNGYRILSETANQRHKSAGSIQTLADAAEKYTAHVSQLDKNRFMTGLDPLDAVIKGVSPGEVFTVAAYSGLGKSAFLHNILLDSCRRTDLHHIFFSLEMPSTRVFERTVQIALGRLTYEIESQFHNHNKEKRATTMIELASVNANKLLICEEGGITLEKIELYTEQSRAKYGKIGAIGIDYLGLLSAPGTRGEYERVSAVAEGIKTLAKRLEVPVIMLCQISREAARAGSVEMSSAKGSGAVEASADYMISLQHSKEKEVLLKLLKNRNGEANISYVCDIQWPYLRFNSIRPCDANAEKNVERGRERQRKGYISNPDESDYPF
jgi:replicative DNA helicase